jgi:hypothetical protein
MNTLGLIAAGQWQWHGELLWIVVVIAVMVIRILAAMANSMQAKPPAPPRDPNVEDEITDFLRRAAGQQQQQPPADAGEGNSWEPASPPQAQTPPLPSRQRTETRRPSRGRTGESRRPRPSAAGDPRPVMAEAVDDEPVGDEVARQVKSYLDTGDFSRRSQQLGEEVVQSDQQFENRLQQTFGGEVSRLANRPGESAAAPEPELVEASGESVSLVAAGAAGLAYFLADPDNLRQAIVLNEVLRRPEAFWE